MPAYVVLINFTDQGIRSVENTVDRAKEAARAAESLGGRFIGTWWTLGQYDAVTVIEAPNDEALMQALLAIGTEGNIRTTTLRAFSEEEMGRIVEGLP